MDKKKSSFINTIKSSGRRVRYINNVGKIDSSEEKKFCQDNLLMHMIKNKPLLRDIGIVITRRNTDIMSGLIGLNSFIFVYEDHVTSTEKKWLAIMCIENAYRKETRDHSTRVYCLGFIENQDIQRSYIKMHPSGDLLIHGVKPEMPFYMLCINKLCDEISESGQEVEEIIPASNDDAEILPRREASSLYVFVLGWIPPDETQVYDMTNLESECSEKLDLLWRMRNNGHDIKREIKTRMTDIENWYKDMRTTHALLLVMCWDETWRLWYIESEREYVETICGCMIDLDDMILNRNYNRLNGDVLITEKNRDMSVVTKMFSQLHGDRISIYMRKWMKKRRSSDEMPVVLVKFMEKIYATLSILKDS